MSADTQDHPPIALIHGWGGSFAATWEGSGFTALLADARRDVIGIDLLGHGTAPKPHDPDAYRDLTERVMEAIDAESPNEPVDAVGFSLGAMTLLRAAIAHPDRFRRLVIAGVGKNLFERDDDGTKRIIAAVEGDGSVDDNQARLFAQYSQQPGNDAAALAAVLKRPPGTPITEEALATLAMPVLVVVGERDFVMPPDRLVDALPNAEARILRRTDHFATPESFDFIDATLEFLDAVPA